MATLEQADEFIALGSHNHFRYGKKLLNKSGHAPASCHYMSVAMLYALK
jgi:hypothetical protein